MRVTSLPAWNVRPIEIALDLEPSRRSVPAVAASSGPWEPRISLVACFVFISHLNRLVAAVDRVVPARLPSGLRIVSAKVRSASRPPGAISIAPMLPLLRLQYRLIRAIEPGIAVVGVENVLARTTEMDRVTAEFICGFIPNETPPTFEPPLVTTADIPSVRLRAVGITLYQLEPCGAAQSVLGHWAYAPSSRRSIVKSFIADKREC